MSTPPTAPPRPPGTKPRVIDARFRQRLIEVRRLEGRRRLRVLIILGVFVGAALLAWGVTRSPFLDVDHVEVSGTVHTTPADMSPAVAGVHASPFCAHHDAPSESPSATDHATGGGGVFLQLAIAQNTTAHASALRRLQAFRKLEADQQFGDNQLHGADGPMPVTRWDAGDLIPLQQAFLDACPDLKVCVAHGGGPACFAMGRLDRGWQGTADALRVIKQAPSTYQRRLYYDTVVGSEKALRFLLDEVGADRVVLGSDWPFVPWHPSPVAWVQGLKSLTQDEKDRIVSRNLETLLGV